MYEYRSWGASTCAVAGVDLRVVSLIAGDARRVVRVTLRLADGRETDVEIEAQRARPRARSRPDLALQAGTPARDGLHRLRLGPLPASWRCGAPARATATSSPRSASAGRPGHAERHGGAPRRARGRGVAAAGRRVGAPPGGTPSAATPASPSRSTTRRCRGTTSSCRSRRRAWARSSTWGPATRRRSTMPACRRGPRPLGPEEQQVEAGPSLLATGPGARLTQPSGRAARRHGLQPPAA
jgi:hypothetical protein